MQEWVKDVVDILRVITWPLVVLVGLLLFREPLSGFLRSMGARVQSVKFSILEVVSVELKGATEAKLESPLFQDRLDMGEATRRFPTSSHVQTLLEQFADGKPRDYIVVDLGTGSEWLTSRLFLFAVMLRRMCDLRRVVFVHTSEGVRQRLVGIAAPEEVRWALARRYPWLEDAYTKACQDAIGAHSYVITSNRGGLNRDSAQLVVHNFISTVQMPPTDPRESGWVDLGVPPGTTREHAAWLTAPLLCDVLGDSLQRRDVRFTDTPELPRTERAFAVLRRKGLLVALVDEDGELSGVVDREALVERVVTHLAQVPDKGAVREPKDSSLVS